MTTSSKSAMTALQWQLARDAAQHYAQVLVPAYLGPAAQAVVERAAPSGSETVLDVGCGTGAAAAAARDRLGATGRIVAVDVNRYMLDVAREVLGPHDGAAPVDLREGDARQLPLRDHCVDVVVCANTLQFVPERARACAQMVRVLVPGGRAAVGTWASIEENPYFDALARAIDRTMGPQVATHLTSACTLGSAPELWGALRAGGFEDIAVENVTLDVTLGDLTTFVPRHLASTPMAAAFRGAGDEAVHDVVEQVVGALGGAAGRSVPFHLLVAGARSPAA
ncbi:class I SAM-dependent methyltransferase [Kineosporia sp. R_H_3]|uniref:class I SAM-dependent methyltransferase n=1 Tax=Kineosporia sp. R_H_3 TaxID=1961848 RepID=UPI001179DC9F|nr:methyltransferase domain-containing protein [Kineosporia sp. R_H_3]